MVLKEMSDIISLKKELDDLKLKLFTIVRRIDSFNEIERIDVYKELIQQETFLKDLNNEISELLDLIKQIKDQIQKKL
jgi:ribosome-binding factor A